MFTFGKLVTYYVILGILSPKTIRTSACLGYYFTTGLLLRINAFRMTQSLASQDPVLLLLLLVSTVDRHQQPASPKQRT